MKDFPTPLDLLLILIDGGEKPVLGSVESNTLCLSCLTNFCNA
jgi:hypothetical protein